jgi:hypothetical protein
MDKPLIPSTKKGAREKASHDENWKVKTIKMIVEDEDSGKTMLDIAVKLFKGRAEKMRFSILKVY